MVPPKMLVWTALLVSQLSTFPATTNGQFFLVPSSFGRGASRSPWGKEEKCPAVAPKSPHQCAGQQSTCWSPGVRDTDCPSHGLCCFNGCVNICRGPPQQSPSRPPPTVVDPCNPSPCGPGTTCTPSPNGNSLCRCKPGLIPKPDTITGCGPECVRDPDCSFGKICQNQRCIEKPDPCNPSPCGPGATCSVSSTGNAICRCEPGLIPKPDTITGCGPECIIDPDCQTGYICENQRCIEKPDPCNPSPCGPGAVCMANSFGNPICRCEPGLIPKPDTITGCGPECVRDPDCQTGYICQDQRCIEKPDPCDPSPCGPGTMCMANKFGNPICRCLGKLVPKPDTITGCGPECLRDSDCHLGFVCQDQVCVEAPDPCNPDPCGRNAECRSLGTTSHQCQCPTGFFGDANIECIQGECQTDEECRSDQACLDYYCKNPCKSDTCLKDYFCKVVNHNPTCGLAYEPEEPAARDTFVIGESYSNQLIQDSRSSVVIGGANGASQSRSSVRTSGQDSRQTSSKGSPRDLTVIGAAYNRKKRQQQRFLMIMNQRGQD